MRTISATAVTHLFPAMNYALGTLYRINSHHSRCNGTVIAFATPLLSRLHTKTSGVASNLL